MQKTQFLKEVSMLTREDLEKFLNKNCKRVKKLFPVVFIRPSGLNREEDKGQ
nr:MAG TPA: hypothetical protein [Caudoviricetes sp.]